MCLIDSRPLSRSVLFSVPCSAQEDGCPASPPVAPPSPPVLYSGTEVFSREKTPMQQTELPNSDAAIIARVIQPDHDDLPPTAARALLKLGFTAADRERMHELAVK